MGAYKISIMKKRVQDPAAEMATYDPLGTNLRNKNEITAGKLLGRKIQVADT